MLPHQVSEHFATSEFASRRGVPVPAESWRVLVALCTRYLEPLRERFGRVTITSGHRPLAENAEAGGAPRSQHVYGRFGRGVAVDLVCERGTPTQWYRFLDQLGIGGLGLYADHIHADNRTGRARW